MERVQRMTSRPEPSSRPALAPRIVGWAAGWAVASVLAASPLLSGCQSTLTPPTGDLLVDLAHPDPRIRILAAKWSVSANGGIDRRTIERRLVDNLEHRDGAVRLYSAIALRKLTGEDLGFRPYGTPEEREAVVRALRERLGDVASDVPPAAGQPTVPPPRVAAPETSTGVTARR